MTTRLRANINHELLIWGRKSSKMPVEAASRKIGVSAEMLTAWEEGSISPTIVQLKKCASVYHRPLSIFFLSVPPLLPEDIQDFRRVAGAEALLDMDKISFELRRIQYSREIALELHTSKGEPAPEFDLTAQATDAVLNVAQAIRGALGISVDAQKQLPDSRTALKQWIFKVETLGVLVFQCSRIDVSAMRGASLGATPLPMILLNGGDAANGRIFTLMHELAHLMIHQSGLCDTVEYRGDQSANQRVETFCNRVAGSALVPPDVFLQEYEVAVAHGTDYWTSERLEILAQRYSVSREVILGRLLHLNRVSQSRYEILLDLLREEVRNRLRTKSTGGNPFRTALRNAGFAFSSLVLDAYHRKAIGAGDAAEYLGVKIRGLGRLQEYLVGG